jgi:CheY-like chemotaxis protein
MDHWRYAFADASRIRDFTLTMNTDFSDVNFPISSPTDRKPQEKGMQLVWKYEDAISAPGIGMEMPRELNAGPVAAQISFYAPLSLLLFFMVIIITVISRGVSLHPVNYFFLAAGFFAFPLLFSYMLDVVPVHLSFVIAALAPCCSSAATCVPPRGIHLPRRRGRPNRLHGAVQLQLLLQRPHRTHAHRWRHRHPRRFDGPDRQSGLEPEARRGFAASGVNCTSSTGLTGFTLDSHDSEAHQFSCSSFPIPVNPSKSAVVMPTRILVVEDEPSICENVVYALEADGFAVATAATGREALEQMKSQTFDLIILDVGLPDMTGFEVCKAIRKTQSLPILFLTARSSEVDRVVGLEIGGDDYVVKPFSPRELVARVRAILRRVSATPLPPNGHDCLHPARHRRSALPGHLLRHVAEPLPLRIPHAEGLRRASGPRLQPRTAHGPRFRGTRRLHGAHRGHAHQNAAFPHARCAVGH